MQKEFYIIRHGQTDLNKAGIVQGRGVNSELNEKGREQASRFFNLYQEAPFDKIYTSSLIRTWQTVGPFLDLGIPWEKLDGLDEMDWGIYEGLEASEKTREGFRNLLKKWAEGDYEAAIERGESPLEVQERQKIALDYILKKEEKTILICMHGRAIRLFLCLLLGLEIREMDSFPHQNLSLYRLSYENEVFKILEFNNTAHVEDALNP